MTKVQTNHKGALNHRIRLRSKSDQWLNRWAGLTRSLARHRSQISSPWRSLHCNRRSKQFLDQPLVSAVYPSWRVAETRRSDFERFLRRQLNKVVGVLTKISSSNRGFWLGIYTREVETEPSEYLVPQEKPLNSEHSMHSEYQHISAGLKPRYMK